MRHFGSIGLGIVISFFLITSAAPTLAQPAVTDQAFEKVLEKFILQKYTPEEIQPILSAEVAENHKAVVELADALLGRSPESFEDTYYGYWIHSLAYMHRGRAREKLGEGFKTALDDEKRAADLGNLDAIKNVVHLLLEDNILEHREVERYLRMGAELGDPFCQAMLGLESIPIEMSEGERTYWFLLAVVGDYGLEAERKAKILNEGIKEIGQAKIESALSQYSVVGGIRSALGNLPGRGIVETFCVETDLRGTLGHLYGIKSLDKVDEIPVAPTLGENWLLYKRIVECGKAYMLVPGSRQFEDPDIFSLPRANITEAIGPGDRVFVRCGPFSHVGMVYKVDKSGGTISFIDAAYQFWQPSHNSCVKSFRRIRHIDNRYLAMVNLAEVGSMLDAVITVRDARKGMEPLKPAVPERKSLTKGVRKGYTRPESRLQSALDRRQ